MARYPSGQPVRLSTTVTDIASGNLINATTLTLTLQKPDATQATFSSPTNDSTGLYHQDLATTDLSQIGRYQYKWVATGSGAGVSIGGLDVYDPFEVRVLSLQDMKSACNIPQAVTRFDDELQDMTGTVESILERLTGGPIITRQVSEIALPVNKEFTTIVLKYRPVVDVVSVTDWLGVVQPITDIKIDPMSNTIYRAGGLPFLGSGAVFTPFVRYDVVYHAGWTATSPPAPIPPAFLTAGRIIGQHLWETQRGPSDNPTIGGFGVTPNEAANAASYGAPFRALEVLSPYLLEAYI